ncbi:GNAT family N-acetyltransferase [Kitasatospora kifunensis]|uniref:RimJ/RimL family protein N-acetyltransferase n=1 Tax=Kitasatospora kifunensis TaxID=58351 RepID=A0A7W7R3G7_KITKI|nr:GNAT family N-acetyltransferase [Kitasatospora kifunensis]MBB4924639.1 RimJ/RimL family protein N-acetyltransferase [Kitasatospora kifunensis]
MSENPPAPTAIATERLDLRAVHLDDLDALHEINRDPAVWRHQPAGRHAELAQTRDWIERAAARWPEGLSYWTARLRGTQTVVGVGGVQAQGRGHWNLYYRLAPAHWGRGYATELSRAAIAAAHRQQPELPVFAWIHGHNAGSRAVAGRLGLIDHGLRLDPFLRELLHLYADRPLPEERADVPI